MAKVWIPSLLRDMTGGLSELDVPGETVRDVIEQLEARYPGLGERLCQDGRLQPNIAVVVDGVNSRQGLRQRLVDSSEVHFVPAIGGGSTGT